MMRLDKVPQPANLDNKGISAPPHFQKHSSHARLHTNYGSPRSRQASEVRRVTPAVIFRVRQWKPALTSEGGEPGFLVWFVLLEKPITMMPFQQLCHSR